MCQRFYHQNVPDVHVPKDHKLTPTNPIFVPNGHIPEVQRLTPANPTFVPNVHVP